jgi:ribosomal protein S18 acetylase RimI-like enzyme
MIQFRIIAFIIGLSASPFLSIFSFFLNANIRQNQIAVFGGMTFLWRIGFVFFRAIPKASLSSGGKSQACDCPSQGSAYLDFQAFLWFNEGMKIEIMDLVTDEVISAFRHLTPQLNAKVKPPGKKELQEILNSGCTRIFLARDDQDVIVGALALVIFRTPNGLHTWIEDVVVDQAARGQGIGEALNRAALAAARQRGASDVNLTSRPEREAANRLYQRLGFQLRQSNLYRLHLKK